MAWNDHIYPTDPFSTNPAFAYTYNSDKTLATLTATYDDGTQYRKTFTYNASKQVTNITKWTKV